MKKDEFINQLRSYLTKLPPDELDGILADYEEHFQHGLLKGRSEEEICQSLGNPEKLAKELLADTYLQKAEQTPTISQTMHAVIATISLGFFNLILVLAPFLVICSLIFTFYTVSIIFISIPLFAMITIFYEPTSKVIFNLFFSMILSGAGLLLFQGCNSLTKLTLKTFHRYLRWNIKVIKGDDVA